MIGPLQELFGRIPGHIHEAVDGLSAPDLVEATAQGANTIAWLVWHLTRVQDHHVAELLEAEQVWTTEPWPERFGLEGDANDTGYGHNAEQVASVRPDGSDALIGYYESVAARTSQLLATPRAGKRPVVERRCDTLAESGSSRWRTDLFRRPALDRRGGDAVLAVTGT